MLSKLSMIINDIDSNIITAFDNSYLLIITYEDSNKVKQIKNNNTVSLIYQNDDMLFIDCYGKASVVTDKETLEEKWVDGLEQWFPEGTDTPGICLLKVSAERVTFWHKEDEGEYTV